MYNCSCHASKLTSPVSLLNILFVENQELATFIGELHENRIREFKELDKKILVLNRKRIFHKLNSNIPKIFGGTENPQAKILAGEFTRKSGHMPVRKLLEKAGGMIKQIKPCFMMSPLSIAQYLDPTNEELQFDVVIYDGTDASEKSNFASFVKSQSNDEGSKCQLVVSNYASADNECIISVQPQSITLLDGTTLDAGKLTWWVGGASAGANAYESLTYASHPDAVSVSPALTKSEQEAAINAGNFALIGQFDKVQVLTDINTFHSFSPNKGKAFKKNRVVRTVFGVCNDVYKAFSLYYIGAVHNDEDGRKALKAEILNILNRYQGNRALQNVVADDVTVMKGEDVDAVVIEIYMQPVDSIEKIYINITIS